MSPRQARPSPHTRSWSRRPRPLGERFWEKVDKAGGTESCWLWLAGLNGGGYGQFRVATGKMIVAHRMAYQLVHGPIPDGLIACHRCDNPPCCNPAHLFLGTDADNIADKIAKGRQGVFVPETRRGAACNLARLTEEQVRAIRAARAAGASFRDLSADYPVTIGYLRRIAAGETWRHVS